MLNIGTAKFGVKELISKVWTPAVSVVYAYRLRNLLKLCTHYVWFQHNKGTESNSRKKIKLSVEYRQAEHFMKAIAQIKIKYVENMWIESI